MSSNSNNVKRKVYLEPNSSVVIPRNTLKVRIIRGLLVKNFHSIQSQRKILQKSWIENILFWVSVLVLARVLGTRYARGVESIAYLVPRTLASTGSETQNKIMAIQFFCKCNISNQIKSMNK